MIGKISIGKSFGGCLRYCLEDKEELSQEQKMALSKQDSLQHENRAEVLEYNMCFGNKKELITQFNDVRALRPQLSQPVMHISLSLDPEDRFTKEKLRQIGQDFAHEFGFEKNQYLTIYHKDTKHPHLHIVANRVGFDGSRISDSNSYRKVAELCRKLEIKHELKQVLSPQRFLSREQKMVRKPENRIDQRKERLKENIRECLLDASGFQDFTHKMKQLGVQVIKSRGISFIDDKKMQVKGSELGYSLNTIEKILGYSLEKRQQLHQKLEQEKKQMTISKNRQQLKSIPSEINKFILQEKQLDLAEALEILLRTERDYSQTPSELFQRKRKRKHL
jgi:hypothetical protein